MEIFSETERLELDLRQRAIIPSASFFDFYYTTLNFTSLISSPSAKQVNQGASRLRVEQGCTGGSTEAIAECEPGLRVTRVAHFLTITLLGLKTGLSKIWRQRRQFSRTRLVPG